MNCHNHGYFCFAILLGSIIGDRRNCPVGHDYALALKVHQQPGNQSRAVLVLKASSSCYTCSINSAYIGLGATFLRSRQMSAAVSLHGEQPRKNRRRRWWRTQKQTKIQYITANLYARHEHARQESCIAVRHCLFQRPCCRNERPRLYIYFLPA